MGLHALICELNPIHLGHVVVIERARSAAGVTAAVLSGNFTQRGEPALYDKYARAHSALLAGCDLVFELPFPWCSAGVEAFALGGVTVAAGVGAEGLTFGSESGRLDDIEQIAAVKASPEFAAAVRAEEAAARDAGSAVIFEQVLHRFGLEEMPGANDKLGAEYIRFGREAGIAHFTAVERLRGLKSASALRAMDFADCEPYMPPESFSFLRTAARCDYAKYAEILFHHARLYLAGTDHPVLQIAAKKARAVTEAGEFLHTAATKKYTAARVRRELLFSVTNVRAEWLKTPPRYTILLAANERGRRYLSENRRTLPFPIVTKPADYVPADDTDAEIRRCHVRADELYSLVNGLPADSFMKRHPVML
ncbi:MAG: nucleotidyltransferase family protein [Eubacteriales bacterium]